MVKEECYNQDVLSTGRKALKPTGAEAVFKPIQQNEKQHKFLYDNKQTGKPLWFPPRVQYEAGKTSLVEWSETLTRKIICHYLYCKEHIAP